MCVLMRIGSGGGGAAACCFYTALSRVALLLCERAIVKVHARGCRRPHRCRRRRLLMVRGWYSSSSGN